MSLEASIASLTAANNELRETIAALIERLASGAPIAAGAEAPKRTRRTKAEIEAAATPAEQPAAPALAPLTAAQETVAQQPVVDATPVAPVPAAAPAAPAGMTYDGDVKPAIMAALQKPDVGPAKVLGVLQGFGVANAKDLPADRWPDLIAAVNALSAPAPAAATMF